jgi:hypothetical protein
MFSQQFFEVSKKAIDAIDVAHGREDGPRRWPACAREVAACS